MGYVSLKHDISLSVLAIMTKRLKSNYGDDHHQRLDVDIAHLQKDKGIKCDMLYKNTSLLTTIPYLAQKYDEELP